MISQRWNEIWAIVFIGVTVLVAASLISYDPMDLTANAYPANPRIYNYAGWVGANLADILFKGVGRAAFLVPILTLIWAISRFLKEPIKIQKYYVKGLAVLVLFASSASLLYMNTRLDEVRKFTSGGFVGSVTSGFLMKYFGIVGTHVILITLLVLSALLATEFLIWELSKGLFKEVKRVTTWLFSAMRQRRAPGVRGQERPVVPTKESLARVKELKEIALKEARVKDAKLKEAAARLEKVVGLPKEREARREIPREPEIKISTLPKLKPAPRPEARPEAKPQVAVAKLSIVTARGYKLPGTGLLDAPPPISERLIEDDLKTNSAILEETLADFGIEVKVVRVNRGPTITLYELEPAPGVKVNRITTLSDDIALAMKAQSIRIVAPIPGEGTVGVEVPNTSTSLVYLREVLECDEFKGAESKLTMALGKDIGGTPIITDLSDMPHLLIAGATGSGKTVCVNAIISSILFKATPDEVKFLMVDPKMVELAIFNGLPHLLAPVITDYKRVAGALEWLVQEMEGRYQLFAKIGVRNIDLYNEKMQNNSKEKEEQKEADKDKEKEKEEEYPRLLPYIILVIDELADLMLVSQQDIESAITRLAQLSRAVGIHIILATQRPSVDVITGVIKANFPARISFKVASKVDSRTVLDMNGADKLLGKGDMLFIEPGASKPIRAQGSLVQDKELERVIEYLKSQCQPQYNEGILKSQDKKATFREFQKDEVYEEAVKLVLQTRQASVSVLQRKLGLGYTRAARIIDMMEDEGIVGPYQGSRPREILVENLEALQKEDRAS